MRIVFAGTPSVALPTLIALQKSGHQVVGVLTRPPARKGRSSKLIDSPVAEYAKANGLNLKESSRPSKEEDVRWIRDLEADAGVVVAYGALLTPSVLESTNLGWLNLHFSTLPDLRGAAPVQRALLRGDTQIGTTVFLLDPGMDSGPIVTVEQHAIGSGATAGEVLDQLAQTGSEQVIRSLDLIADSGFAPTPQDTGTDGNLITLAPKLTKEDGFISFSEGATRTVDRARAVSPSPGAWTTDASGRSMKLRGLQAARRQQLEEGHIGLEGQTLYVGTSESDVLVTDVAPAGKSWMKAADWARGARMDSSQRLGLRDAE